jgi:uncharacterized membrane protein YkvA (DUF1232 family)
MLEKPEEKEMETTLTTKAKEPGFWRELIHQARLVYALIRDPEVPIYLKILPFLGFVYLVLPFDLVPDVLIGLGQLDDLTVLLIGSKIFVELAPPHVVAKHRQAIRESDGFLTAANDEVDKAIIIDSDHEIIVEKDAE